MSENFSQQQIEFMLDHHRELSIGKTNNRSVLGSMTDLAYHLEYEIHFKGGLLNADLGGLNRFLNRIPMGRLGGKYAIDEMRRLLDR